MLDYTKQVQSIYDFLKRSETEQKYPYAYEIFLLTGVDEAAVTSRTSGTSKFKQDIEGAIERAKHSIATIRVDIYAGKSHNARKIGSYIVNVSGLMAPQKQTLEKEEIKSLIKEEINQMPPPQNGLNDLNNLLGMVTGNQEGLQGIDGLFGLFNTISGHNKELDRIGYQKQLDDFKYETRFNALQDKYERACQENEVLRKMNGQLSDENKGLKEENAGLENKLIGYAPNELMKRVAVGVLSGIGGRILGNSPKTAELFGLTQDELKGALGIVDEPANKAITTSQANVEVSEINEAQGPEGQQKARIIQNIADALSQRGLNDIAKITHIIGALLDQPERIDQVVTFLNQALKGGQEQEGEGTGHEDELDIE